VATSPVASYGKEDVLLSPGVRFRRFEGLAHGMYFIRKEVEARGAVRFFRTAHDKGTEVQRTLYLAKAKLTPMCSRPLRYRLVISTRVESPGTGHTFRFDLSKSWTLHAEKGPFTSITQLSVRKNRAHRTQFPVALFGLCYQSIYARWAHRFTSGAGHLG